MLFALLLIIDALLWLALIVLRAVSLRSSELSNYELERRVKNGDEAAARTQQWGKMLPDVRELKYLTETLLFVIVIVATVCLVGPWWAILIMFAVLLQIEATIRSRWVMERAQRLFHKYEAEVLAFTERVQPLLKRLRGDTPITDGTLVYSKQELLDRLAEGDVLNAHELSMIEHGLAFGGMRVEDVMTPSTVIDAVKEAETLGPVVLTRLHKSGHSRFPVYAEDLNHVVGMLYMHDLVPLRKNVRLVGDAMDTEVFYIRQDHDLERALAAFLRTHHHLFIVVNKYRETVGLLSLEDVIEALLGRKIVDEFDEYHDLRAVAEKNPRDNNLPVNRKDV